MSVVLHSKKFFGTQLLSWSHLAPDKKSEGLLVSTTVSSQVAEVTTASVASCSAVTVVKS